MSNRPPYTPTKNDLDAIDAESGPCRVLGPFGPEMILVSDLTSTIRRLRSMLATEQEQRCEFVNDLLEHAPEHYDDDEAAEAIALRYVRDLEAHVLALPELHTAIKRVLAAAECPGSSNPAMAMHCAECCYGTGLVADCAEELAALRALVAADIALDALAALASPAVQS